MFNFDFECTGKLRKSVAATSLDEIDSLVSNRSRLVEGTSPKYSWMFVEEKSDLPKTNKSLKLTKRRSIVLSSDSTADDDRSIDSSSTELVDVVQDLEFSTTSDRSSGADDM